MTVILTRRDYAFAPPFDSIAWALSEHVKQPDTGEYRFAILEGNEDAPDKIEFWRSADPHYDQPADFTWKPVDITNACAEGCACPSCGESDTDNLVIDEEAEQDDAQFVDCLTCGQRYRLDFLGVGKGFRAFKL